MLESLVVFALVLGAWRAGQLRRTWELWSACAALYLVVADFMNMRASTFSDLHPLHVFIFAFLGPSMWHRRGDGWLPLPRGLDEPMIVRSVRVAICVLAVWRSTRDANARPLLPESDALRWMATPFVGALVLDLLEGVLVIAVVRLV
jgi:hypothetical protein